MAIPKLLHGLRYPARTDDTRKSRAYRYRHFGRVANARWVINTHLTQCPNSSHLSGPRPPWDLKRSRAPPAQSFTQRPPDRTHAYKGIRHRGTSTPFFFPSPPGLLLCNSRREPPVSLLQAPTRNHNQLLTMRFSGLALVGMAGTALALPGQQRRDTVAELNAKYQSDYAVWQTATANKAELEAAWQSDYAALVSAMRQPAVEAAVTQTPEPSASRGPYGLGPGNSHPGPSGGFRGGHPGGRPSGFPSGFPSGLPSGLPSGFPGGAYHDRRPTGTQSWVTRPYGAPLAAFSNHRYGHGPVIPWWKKGSSTDGPSVTPAATGTGEPLDNTPGPDHGIIQNQAKRDVDEGHPTSTTTSTVPAEELTVPTSAADASEPLEKRVIIFKPTTTALEVDDSPQTTSETTNAPAIESNGGRYSYDLPANDVEASNKLPTDPTGNPFIQT